MGDSIRHEFKTEVKQLLDLVIHSLYSNRDIFLRELISNASDAVDRLRFESVSNQDLLGDDTEFRISLIPDTEANTLTIADNGIGMTAEEAEANIGTIASSGTRRFMDALKESGGSDAPDLIGQFGVGFYSAFMVADRVTVVTRKAGSDEAVRWESEGEGAYTLEKAEKAERGTSITLHLREEMKEYLEQWKLRKIVKQFSDFVEYPVVMPVETSEVPTDDNGDPIEGADPVTKVEEATLNSMKALWMRPKAEVTEDEHKEFYQHISNDYADPAFTIHYKAEGMLEFAVLLYLPSKAPFDMFRQQDDRKGLHLYVKRVFISDDCRELLPEYLRFVSGVVESNDLPLNVSREILQENRVIRQIRKNLVSKILGTLKEKKNKAYDDYVAFWKEFGRVLKEGVHMDFENREKLQELLLLESTITEEDKFTTLKDYVTGMPDDQEFIYYLTGTDRESLANSPYLEAAKSRGYEVLLLTDPIDEWLVQDLTEYDGKKLKALDRSGSELESDDDKEKLEKAAESCKSLTEVIGKQLEGRVKEVRLSSRLTDSVACLIVDENGMNANMERIMKAFNQDAMNTGRILELNPTHELTEQMVAIANEDGESPRLNDFIELVYSQALLNEGSPLKDPGEFAAIMTRVMTAAANVPLDPK